jgi:hypothetical protein
MRASAAVNDPLAAAEALPALGASTRTQTFRATFPRCIATLSARLRMR